MAEYQSIHTGQVIDSAVSIAHEHTNKGELDSFDIGQVEGRQGNTGFVATALPDVTFDNATRTFTVSSPVAYTAEYWIQGTKHLISTPITFVIPDTEGMHYLYIKSDGTIGRDDNFSSPMVYNNAYITAIYWDATNKVVIYRGDERHTTSWHRDVHLYHHATSGASYSNGFTPHNYIADGTGALNSHAQVTTGNGVFYDEDIRHVVDAATTYRIFYRTGAGLWRVQDSDYPVLTTGSGRAAYNEFDGNVWTQQEVEDGYFTLSHILVTNDLNGKVIVVQGTGQYQSIGLATIEAQKQLMDLQNLPFEEMIPVATLAFETRDTYTNAVKSRLRTNDLGGAFIDWRDSENNILMAVDSSTPIIFQLLGEQNKSIGLITKPTIDIDTVNHTISVGECRVFIGRLPSFDDDSPGRVFTVPPAVFNTVDQTFYYIKVERTNNTVQYIAPTFDDAIQQANRVDVARVIRTGPAYHTFRFNTLGLSLPNKLESIERNEGFKVVTGLGISANASRTAFVETGVATLGATQKELTPVDTSIHSIRSYIWDGTQYNFALISVLNNTEYNGSTGLVQAQNNKYVRQSLFRGVEDQEHLYLVYHRQQFDSLAEAIEDSLPPLPAIISAHAVYVGGVIYQRDSNTPNYVLPTTNGGTGGSVTTTHNDLAGIQGGNLAERFHLTQDKHTIANYIGEAGDGKPLWKNSAWPGSDDIDNTVIPTFFTATLNQTTFNVGVDFDAATTMVYRNGSLIRDWTKVGNDVVISYALEGDEITVTTIVDVKGDLDTKLGALEASTQEYLGWRDLKGAITVRGSGPNNPEWVQFTQGIYAYNFPDSTMKEAWQSFHLDHDYAQGTPLLLHVHWATTSTAIGTVRWGFEYTIAKGHAQGADSVFDEPTIVYAETTTQGNLREHFITEISIANAPSTAKMEPDTIILVRVFRDAAHANDTYPSSAATFQADAHYQFDRYGTISRFPNFYVEAV